MRKSFVSAVIACLLSSGPCCAIKGLSRTKQTMIPVGKQQPRTLMSFRGGQQSQDPYSYTNYDENTPANYENGFANYNPPSGNAGADPEHIFHETVQDRVDKWRTTQMERSQHLSPQQQNSPRDEDGRMKLLASVGKGSRAMIFFVLMWRDIHLFEVADSTFKGATRLLAVVPLTLLFLGNLSGFYASITSAGHAAKKRLKAVLNLDKLVETLLLIWSLLRLTIAPSKYVARETFISNTLHSIFFLIQCQAYTRVTWDQVSAAPGAPMASEDGGPYAQTQQPAYYTQGSQTNSQYGGY